MEPYHRKADEHAAVLRGRYPDYVSDQRGAHQRGENKRRLIRRMSLPGSVLLFRGKGAAAQHFHELRPRWRQTGDAASKRLCRHFHSGTTTVQLVLLLIASRALISGRRFPGLMATPWLRRRISRLSKV
ncbi:hypothetical protein MTO96_013160 [Rhipicephalus appendiculatus]